MVADIHGRKEPPQDRLAQVRKKMMEVREALEKTETESIKDLKINGNDLINYGLEPGPIFADILKKLWAEVLEGKIKNDRQELLTRAYTLKQGGFMDESLS